MDMNHWLLTSAQQEDSSCNLPMDREKFSLKWIQKAKNRSPPCLFGAAFCYVCHEEFLHLQANVRDDKDTGDKTTSKTILTIRCSERVMGLYCCTKDPS